VHLTLLLVLTAIVPLVTQSAYGSGGSIYAAGVLPSDVFLLTGLLRAAVVLPRLRMGRRATVAAALMCGFLVVVGLQMVHAVALGRSVTGVGSEARALISLGVLLVALPIVHDAGGRRRLLTALLCLGFVNGLWGVLQFALQLKFNTPADLGHDATGFGTAGRVIGMYAFPVATVIPLSVLSSGVVRAPRMKLALALVALVNCVAVVVTFERTFWIALIVGVLALGLRGTPRQRKRLFAFAPPAILVVFLILSAFARPLLHAAEGRIASVASYGSDPSVNYRIAESRLVAQRVKEHPLTGSGLGDAIQIGRPGTTQPIKSRTYAENGYLWSAWKLGIPGALLIWSLLLLAVRWSPRRRHPELAAVIAGAQAGLCGLILASYFFPTFNQLQITPVAGLLIAICAAPRARRQTRDAV
jgi:hypothetical protein